MAASTSPDRTAASPAQPAATASDGAAARHAEDAEQVEELLVEEISIDGMCGVY